MKSRGFGSRAPCGARARPCDLDAGVPHLPPSGPSVFHALAGFHPATPVRAYSIPVTLLGFRLQGLVPPRGAAPLSRPLLSCRSFRARGRSATRTDRGFRALIPPENPYCERPKTRRSRCPPGVDPSKAFSSSGVSKNRCPTSVFSGTRKPASFASSHALHQPSLRPTRLCFGVLPRRSSRRLPLARAPAFLGFLTSSRSDPCEPVRVSVTVQPNRLKARVTPRGTVRRP
jgi:hypothetical protein